MNTEITTRPLWLYLWIKWNLFIVALFLDYYLSHEGHRGSLLEKEEDFEDIWVPSG